VRVPAAALRRSMVGEDEVVACAGNVAHVKTVKVGVTSHARFEKLFNRPASKKRKLYNGRIQCNLYQFFGPKPVALQGPFAKPPQE
jgi:hypothetical protein